MQSCLHFFLIALMSLVPMGIGQVTACDLSNMIGIERHHHDGELGAHTSSPHSSEEHGDCEPTPCSDDPVLTVSNAAWVRAHNPVFVDQFLASRVSHTLLSELYESPARAFTSVYSPPEHHLRPMSPIFTGRFLI